MMEVNHGGGGGGGGGRRRGASPSPERGPTRMRARQFGMRKAQIIYYLSRNGQLEHPHFMELPNLPHGHHIRLKDVMERLTVLRGRGMPSLYSWSCKRSYKNGYVWNDLSENDVIYPADGVEYVLKGSEIIPGCSERFQQLRLSSNRHSKPLSLPQRQRVEEMEEDDDEDDGEEVEEEVEVGGERAASNGIRSNYDRRPPYSRCSRGVSTDEIDRAPTLNGADKNRTITSKARGAHHVQTEITLDDDGEGDSPPSTSSSDKPAPAGRFEDGDPVDPAGSGRGSVLLQLIACGSGAAAAAGKGMASGVTCGGSSRRSGGAGGELRKGVVVGRAARAAARAEEEEDEEVVRCMSENPRFGNPQAEDKEYFSGSIVEAALRAPAGHQPALKRSNSCNEERSSKLGIGEEEGGYEGGEQVRGGGVKGRCIPGRKWTCSSSSSSKLQKQQQQQQAKK